MTMTDAERMLNNGKEVETKKLGKITIKELSLEAVIRLTPHIIELIKTIDLNKEGDDTTKGLEFFQSIVQNPRFLPSLKKVVAEASNKDEEVFNEMSPTDWLKILVVLKEVTDWKELTELFPQLLPVGKLLAGEKGKSSN